MHSGATFGEAVIVHSAEQQKRLQAKRQAVEVMQEIATGGLTGTAGGTRPDPRD